MSSKREVILILSDSDDVIIRRSKKKRKRKKKNKSSSSRDKKAKTTITCACCNDVSSGGCLVCNEELRKSADRLDRAQEKKAAGEADCAICMTATTSASQEYTACGHGPFCSECIRRWTRMKPICPICRQALPRPPRREPQPPSSSSSSLVSPSQPAPGPRSFRVNTGYYMQVHDRPSAGSESQTVGVLMGPERFRGTHARTLQCGCRWIRLVDEPVGYVLVRCNLEGMVTPLRFAEL